MNELRVAEILKLESIIDDLRGKKRIYDKAYFEDDESLVSDAVYDEVVATLKSAEERYVEITGSEYQPEKSNLHLVDTPISSDGVMRNTKMYSLDKVHSKPELYKCVSKWASECVTEKNTDLEIVASLKLDGIAIEVIYQNYELVQILTRGHNGWIGEDITDAQHMFTNLANILQIKHDGTDSFDVPTRLEIRGEAVISKDLFNSINADLASKNKRTYASPRHMVSGFLRNRTDEAHLSETIEFIPYGIGKISHLLHGKYATMTMDDYGDYTDVLDMFQVLGFTRLPIAILTVDGNNPLSFEVLQKFFLSKELERHTYKYSIDGIVYALNSGIDRETLGYTEHHPNWAVAYKFPPEMMMTKLLDVILQVGRTGKITPVGIIDPVRIGGVVITRATLCNLDYIGRNDFRIGDTVMLERSGDVIPKIVKYFDPERTSDSVPFPIPGGCPVCGSSTYQYDDVKDVFCSNLECPAVVKFRLLYAVSKECWDIMGLGEAVIEDLLELGVINNVGDIFRLKMSDFQSIELSEKLAKKILEQIEKAKKNMTLSKFITSLSIPNVGSVTARTLAEHFKNLHDLIHADKYQLSLVKGIGSVTTGEIYDFFRSPQWLILSEDFKKLGMGCSSQEKGPLYGINIVITGTFKKINRKNAINLLSSHGANVQGSVSKKTTFLAVGEKPGDKLGDALDFQVPTWTEEDFLKLLLMLNDPDVTRDVLLQYIETVNRGK